ncbi:MAG: HD domain-containing protein [Spirochaetales bacterium]
MQIIQPSKDGTIEAVSVQYVLDNLDALKRNSVPVFRGLKNANGDLKPQRVEPDLAASVPEAERGQKLFLVDRAWKRTLFTSSDTFNAQLAPFAGKSPEERARAVSALKQVIAQLKAEQADPGEKAQAIMDSVKDVFLLNKASLKLKPAEVSEHEKSVAKDTESIISSAMEMADDPALVEGLFAGFQSLSNGQTVNHVLRVFATYSGFVKHYNNQHQAGLVPSLRRIFPRTYLDHYREFVPALKPELLPADSLLTSDNLLQLSKFKPEDMKELALGAFLHDIGKMGNLDYFESDSGYDPAQIRQHVFLSAGLILMNYGADHNLARLLAGDHHNAMNHGDGYGVTRLEREKGRRKPAALERALSSTMEGFVSGQALGFLPVEMLAVADVYDAMIDTSRTYKKALSSAEAVVFLEETMAAKQKLDPVLVDLFIDYLRSNGVDVPDNRGFLYKLRTA